MKLTFLGMLRRKCNILHSLPLPIQHRRCFSGITNRRRRRKFDLPQIKPGIVNPTKVNSLPNTIIKPHYALEGTTSPDPHGKKIPIPSTKDEIEKIKIACSLVRRVLEEAKQICQVGITTEAIDLHLHNFMLSHDAYPSPLNYNGFPKSICTSVNDVICHGIPDTRKLEDGDIINVDVSLFLNGVHGDASETFTIGTIRPEIQSLVDTTKLALDESIKICKPGLPISEIGNLIETLATDRGFSVCPMFVGHGIGTEFHCSPLIHHNKNNIQTVMEKDFVFTIEPILCQGSGEGSFWDDGWTVVTKDGGYTAQFEHTILITENGYEILTI